MLIGASALAASAAPGRLEAARGLAQDRAATLDGLLASLTTHGMFNGVVTIDNEQHTGEVAGKVLYGPGRRR